MHVDYTPEQKAMRAEVRAYFDKLLPVEKQREIAAETDYKIAHEVVRQCALCRGRFAYEVSDQPGVIREPCARGSGAWRAAFDARTICTIPAVVSPKPRTLKTAPIPMAPRIRSFG